MSDWIHDLRRLIQSIDALTQAVRDAHGSGSPSQPATKHDLREFEERMGTQIEDFAAQQKADLDAISTGVAGVASGIKKLDDMITAFQNSPGTLSPTDEAAIADIQAQTKELRTQVESIDVSAPTAPTPVPGQPSGRPQPGLPAKDGQQYPNRQAANQPQNQSQPKR